VSDPAGNGAELTKDERIALQDFVIRVLAAGARLFTMTQEDGSLTRAAAVSELARVRRHAAAGEAVLRPLASLAEPRASDPVEGEHA